MLAPAAPSSSASASEEGPKVDIPSLAPTPMSPSSSHPLHVSPQPAFEPLSTHSLDSLLDEALGREEGDAQDGSKLSRGDAPPPSPKVRILHIQNESVLNDTCSKAFAETC